MKKHFLCLLLGAGFAISALAQNNPLITVNETGQGTLLFPGGSPIPTTGSLALDPGPGGLAAAMTYNLLGPPGLVAGDLIIFDPGTENTSDIVRFNPAGTGNPGYPASLVFYSLLGGGTPADTGFPSALYTNTASATEGLDGITTYTPTSNQPGFVPGFSVTYSIVSIDTPEPTAISLVGLGLAGVVAVRRRSMNRTRSF